MLKKSLHILVVLALLFFMVPQTSLAVTLDWEAMVNSTQTGVRSPGFGNEHNILVTSMTTFNGYLYTATYNDSQGTEIWRTNNGTDWAQVNDDGFGNHTTSAAVLGVFQNQLYAQRSLIAGGVRVYRTSNGTDWEIAKSNLSANISVATTSVVYNNVFYVGGYGAGVQAVVFASTNGTTWTQINADGFGDVDNINVQAMVVFDNSLYVGVLNSTDGAEIWKYDGANWTKNNVSGFDNKDNSAVSGLAVRDSLLYAVTDNDVTGSEVWRTAGDKSWKKVSNAGFGQGKSVDLAYDLTTFDGVLYAGMTRARVFRSADGETWDQVNETGFGFSDNEYVIFGILGDYIYAGVGTEPTPIVVPNTVEIYRYGTPTPEPEPAVEVLPQTGT